MENVKIQFKSGDWWEVVPKISIGMAEAVAKLQERVANFDEVKAALESKKVPPPVKDKEGNDLSFVITQEMLFAGTISWSYGPVTKEIFKRIPLDDYYEMARRVDELYGSIPLSLTGSGTKG